MKNSDYILNLVMNIIELNEDILCLVDIDDIILQRNAFLSILSNEDMTKFTKNELSNINDLMVYMNDLNSQVDEFLYKKLYIRELCNKK